MANLTHFVAKPTIPGMERQKIEGEEIVYCPGSNNDTEATLSGQASCMMF